MYDDHYQNKIQFPHMYICSKTLRFMAIGTTVQLHNLCAGHIFKPCVLSMAMMNHQHIQVKYSITFVMTSGSIVLLDAMHLHSFIG